MHTRYNSFFYLFLVGAMAVLSLASSVSAQDPIVGTWTGTVDQPGSSSYGIVMTLNSPGGGSTEYPSLSCGGSLSGGGSGGIYNFRESITHGRASETSRGCIDGNIKVVMQGSDRMFWEWTGSYQGKAHYASGKLSRSGPSPSGTSPVTTTCGACGKALVSDISYGLGQSQGFRNYTREAGQKYANCTRNIPGNCQESCESGMLYKNLPNCDTFNDPGHKACVKTMLEGTMGKCQ